MQTLALDFETYFDVDYSLKKITTIEYLRHEKFHLHCCSVKLDDGEIKRLIGKQQMEDYFHEILWEETKLIGHNLNFDGGILSVHFDCYPAQYIDTAAMARVVLNWLKFHSLEHVSNYLGVGKKDSTPLMNVQGKRKLTPEEMENLCHYCDGDTLKAYRIYTTLLDFLPEAEYTLMDITTRMFTQPQVHLDPKQLKVFLKDLEEERAALVEESQVTTKQLRSTVQLEEIITRLGGEIPKKESPSKPGIIVTTFEKDHPDVAKLLVHSNPAIRRIIRARLNVMSSIKINRAKRFLAVEACNNSVFPIPLKHAGAHTGRWSGADKLNCQNIPKGPLRHCIVAPPHHKICVVDLSQIEARVTAWFAEHLKLLMKFADPTIDVYSDFAADLYQIPIESIAKDSDERSVGKTCVLGLGFGMGWKKLLYQFQTKWPHIEMTSHQAIHAVQVYRAVNAPIVKFWQFMNEVIVKMYAAPDDAEYGFKCLQYGKGYIKLPSGRCLMYPELRIELQRDENGEVVLGYNGDPREEFVYSHKGNRTKLYGGRLTENVVQATARDLVAEQIIAINPIQRVATMTHDEIMTVPHIANAEKVYKQMISIMIEPPIWAPDLPLDAEGGYNDRYTK